MMIYDALNLVASRLNKHFSSQNPSHQTIAMVSNIYDPNGEPLEIRNNFLLISAAGISSGTMSHDKRGKFSTDPDDGLDEEPFLMNIYMSLVSNFHGESYRKGLDLLSHSIRYLHRTPLISRSNTPDMPASLQKLGIEMVEYDPHETDLPKNFLSPEHKPFALYKLSALSS